MTWLFLHFWNVAATATFRIWSFGKKEPVSQICVVPFYNFDKWITFGPLRIRCLFSIWTTLLITVHTFAVVIISLHIGKYAILLHLTWLNSKKLGFTPFSHYCHEGCTAALVPNSVCSLPESDWVCFQLSLLWTVQRHQHRATVMQQ